MVCSTTGCLFLGSGEFIEYGAQWIHGEKHGVYELAKQHGFVLEKRTDSLDDEDEATGDFVLDCGRTVSEYCLFSLKL